LNGKWQDRGAEKPLNIHTGISKIYAADSTMISYKHHFFTVTFTDLNFMVLEDQTTTLEVKMNVNNWFKEPIVYDFAHWGSEMMGNLEAQDALQQNGQAVFSISK
ncbi:MAG: hypothetical protein LBU51_02640, partial [Bacteroidales bacterium]|jgi:hypothetical protein|nr:hypothetical protein [Bacteroidales bacterium]